MRFALIGAFDRYNLGDMLFPLVAGRLLRRLEGVSIDYYGLISSDYSRFGAVKTKALSELLSEQGRQERTCAVLVGGEILPVGWFGALSNLYPPAEGASIVVPGSGAASDLSRISSKRQLGYTHNMPWLLTPSDFAEPIPLCYLGAGGASLSPAQIPHAVQTLQRSTYASVRDGVTWALVRSSVSACQNEIRLAPDLVAAIDSVVKSEEIAARTSTAVKEMVARMSGDRGYLCLQLSGATDADSVRTVAEQIGMVWRTQSLATVLLPIGLAAGHEDPLALAHVAAQASSPTRMVGPWQTIWDSLYVLMNARVIAGTSLHATILGTAFAVPTIGLTHTICKLEAYRATWGIPSADYCIDVGFLAEAVKAAVGTPRSMLIEAAETQMSLALDNFRCLVDAVRGTPTKDKPDGCSGKTAQDSHAAGSRPGGDFPYQQISGWPSRIPVDDKDAIGVEYWRYKALSLTVRLRDVNREIAKMRATRGWPLLERLSRFGARLRRWNGLTKMEKLHRLRARLRRWMT